MGKRKLPERLFAAYNWTDEAGELGELARLTGDDLDAYCRESYKNFEAYREERDGDVGPDGDLSEGDLHSLHDWLAEGLAHAPA